MPSPRTLARRPAGSGPAARAPGDKASTRTCSRRLGRFTPYHCQNGCLHHAPEHHRARQVRGQAAQCSLCRWLCADDPVAARSAASRASNCHECIMLHAAGPDERSLTMTAHPQGRRQARLCQGACHPRPPSRPLRGPARPRALIMSHRAHPSPLAAGLQGRQARHGGQGRRQDRRHRPGCRLR